jgi:hypothetical protein
MVEFRSQVVEEENRKAPVEFDRRTNPANRNVNKKLTRVFFKLRVAKT